MHIHSLGVHIALTAPKNNEPQKKEQETTLKSASECSDKSASKWKDTVRRIGAFDAESSCITAKECVIHAVKLKGQACESLTEMFLAYTVLFAGNATRHLAPMGKNYVNHATRRR